MNIHIQAIDKTRRFDQNLVLIVLGCQLLLAFLIVEVKLTFAVAIVACMLFLWLALVDFNKALAVGVFLLIFSPTQAYFEISNTLPIITIQRLILVLLTIVWLNKGLSKGIKEKQIPFLVPIGLFSSAVLLSVCFSVDVQRSALCVFAWIVERFLIFFIIITSIEDSKSLKRIFSSILLAGGILAILGIIEKKIGWSITYYLPEPSREEIGASFSVHDLRGSGRVLATMPHPIALGSILVMIFPIAFTMASNQSQGTKKILLWSLLPILSLCTYYTLSRGPWASLLIAIILIMIGMKRHRRKLNLMLLGVLCVFLIRPQVWQSIDWIIGSSLDPNSPVGSSTWDRVGLLDACLKAVKAEPIRFLFGYGPNTYLWMGFEGEHLGIIRTHTSADSSYLRILTETGLLGLTSFIFLFSSFLFYLWRGFRNTNGFTQELIFALIIALSVFVFQMSTVDLYTWHQLAYLLWIIMGLAVTLIENSTAHVNFKVNI